MKWIYICSPYKGDIERNTQKAQSYCRFAYNRGMLPVAPHLHNTQFLDENILKERQAGLRLGIQMLKRCDELWVFGNRVSEGMEAEIKTARQIGIPVCYYTEQCENRSDCK